MGLAQAHMQGEQWEEAVEHLDKVVTDEPKNPQAPPLLARCYLSMGHMEKVREASLPAVYVDVADCSGSYARPTQCFKKP